MEVIQDLDREEDSSEELYYDNWNEPDCEDVEKWPDCRQWYFVQSFWGSNWIDSGYLGLKVDETLSDVGLLSRNQANNEKIELNAEFN